MDDWAAFGDFCPAQSGSISASFGVGIVKRVGNVVDGPNAVWTICRTVYGVCRSVQRLPYLVLSHGIDRCPRPVLGQLVCDAGC